MYTQYTQSHQRSSQSLLNRVSRCSNVFSKYERKEWEKEKFLETNGMCMVDDVIRLLMHKSSGKWLQIRNQQMVLSFYGEQIFFARTSMKCLSQTSSIRSVKERDSREERNSLKLRVICPMLRPIAPTITSTCEFPQLFHELLALNMKNVAIPHGKYNSLFNSNHIGLHRLYRHRFLHAGKRKQSGEYTSCIRKVSLYPEQKRCINAGGCWAFESLLFEIRSRALVALFYTQVFLTKQNYSIQLKHKYKSFAESSKSKKSSSLCGT